MYYICIHICTYVVHVVLKEVCYFKDYNSPGSFGDQIDE